LVLDAWPGSWSVPVYRQQLLRTVPRPNLSEGQNGSATAKNSHSTLLAHDPFTLFHALAVCGGELQKLNAVVVAEDAQPATEKKLFFCCRAMMIDMREDPGLGPWIRQRIRKRVVYNCRVIGASGVCNQKGSAFRLDRRSTGTTRHEIALGKVRCACLRARRGFVRRRFQFGQ
jgi:hypothetical protein